MFLCLFVVFETKKLMIILVVLYQTKIQTYDYLGCAVSNKDTDL